MYWLEVDTSISSCPALTFLLVTSCRRIRAGTELTWDYNYEVGSVEGKVLLCCCGSTECRGRLLWAAAIMDFTSSPASEGNLEPIPHLKPHVLFCVLFKMHLLLCCFINFILYDSSVLPPSPHYVSLHLNKMEIFFSQCVCICSFLKQHR